MKEHVSDSLEFYLLQAEKCITKYGKVINPEDDFIAFVAHYMMLADWRFDPDRGIKIGTFRLSYAKGAIKMYFRKQKKERRTLTNTLDAFTDRRDPLTPVDYDETPENRELLDVVFETMDALAPRERYVLTEVLLEGKRYSDLSRELSISKQGIRNIYDRAIRKTREEVESVLGV